jgi:hypothetical protein
LGGFVRALISRLRRRSTTCCTRVFSAGFSSLVWLNRTGSKISSRPVKQRVWPLCGVALKQPVLELGREQSQHAAQIAVVAECRRHQVVALVDDKQVPRQVGRALGSAAGGQKLLQHLVLPQVVVRRDDPAERAPGIGIHAESLAQLVSLRSIDQVEVVRTSPHLVAPLQSKEAGVRTSTRWMRRRRRSSLRINPASMVFPSPTSSAISRLTRGIRNAFSRGTS